MENRIVFINKQIKQIEKELKISVAKDPDLKQKIDNVTTIYGIAFISAITVVSEMNGFQLFKNRGQVVSYCGLDVVEKQSGSSVLGRTKISKKGNSKVRSVLYMCSLTSVKYDEHAKNLYIRLVSKHGIKKKGLIAVERKLLLLK